MGKSVVLELELNHSIQNTAARENELAAYVVHRRAPAGWRTGWQFVSIGSGGWVNWFDYDSPAPSYWPCELGLAAPARCQRFASCEPPCIGGILAHCGYGYQDCLQSASVEPCHSLGPGARLTEVEMGVEGLGRWDDVEESKGLYSSHPSSRI